MAYKLGSQTGKKAFSGVQHLVDEDVPFGRVDEPKLTKRDRRIIKRENEGRFLKRAITHIFPKIGLKKGGSSGGYSIQKSKTGTLDSGNDASFTEMVKEGKTTKGGFQLFKK